MPNAVDDPELYDTLVVGGQRSPGVVKLSGHDRKIGWDVKKGPGQSGASTTRTSEDPVEFEAAFYLADAEEIAAFRTWLAYVRTTVNGTTPKALDTYHPDLAENDIKSVVLASIGGVAHDGKGGETRKIRLLEYRPARAKGGSPSGSKAKAKTTGGIDPNDPNAAALAELERLRQEYNRTPWG
jgi:hypothetical protein